MPLAHACQSSGSLRSKLVRTPLQPIPSTGLGCRGLCDYAFVCSPSAARPRRPRGSGLKRLDYAEKPCGFFFSPYHHCRTLRSSPGHRITCPGSGNARSSMNAVRRTLRCGLRSCGWPPMSARPVGKTQSWPPLHPAGQARALPTRREFACPRDPYESARVIALLRSGLS